MPTPLDLKSEDDEDEMEKIMLKYALLASAMIVAAPAIAQEQQPQPTPTEVNKTPTTDTIAANDPAAIPPSSAAGQTGAATTGTADQSAGTTGTASTTATGSDKIAQVVDTEFPTYDKDANGSLNSAEFGSWMVALRTASDASIKAESKEMKTWAKTAFAQADIDKSKSISKAELTGFLAKGQS